MSRHRYVPSSVHLGLKAKPWIGALVVALACSGAQAAVLGHSRLASVLGQPLRIDIQVSQLGADERSTLVASPAPAAAWAAAGLTPPVDLSSLRVSIADGYAPGTRVIHVTSSQSFNGPLADLLLDVRSASGNQRYQVSLLAQGQMRRPWPLHARGRPVAHPVRLPSQRRPSAYGMATPCFPLPNAMQYRV